MSRFDSLSAELSQLRSRRTAAVLIPATAAGFFALYAAGSLSAISLFTGIGSFLGGLGVFHCLWLVVVPRYREWIKRSAAINMEISRIRRAVEAVFEKHRERRKGEQFKNAYALSGRALFELEEVLGVGMYRERREVFVTAFMRGGVAVHVTASIGSLFRCAPADNPARWKTHVERLACDEVRQYHNHPVYYGNTSPSRTDCDTDKTLRRFLGPHEFKLRCFIICWNEIREWRVFEYDRTGMCWLHCELDATEAQPAPRAFHRRVEKP